MTKLLFFLLSVPLLAMGQRGERLQPGKMYEAGDSLYAPHFGFSAIVPTGWSGLLPRETEVFLLSSSYSPAEVYVFGREEGNLPDMKASWEKGVKLDDKISIKAKSAVIKDGILSTEAFLTGGQTDKSKRGYAVARCSEFGPCITFLAVIPASQYDKLIRDVDAFAGGSFFTKPSDASPYANLDWKKFLGGKTLIALALLEKGSKESRVELCKDGTFSANISKKGIMKNQNPSYRGKLSGTWTTDGIGETTKLILEFKKMSLPPLEVDLRIKDEKIYANGERYFAGESDKCK